MTTTPSAAPDYPARYDVAYPERLSRITTLFRGILILPVLVVLALATNGGSYLVVGIVLMLLFVAKYPRQWFDWMLYMQQFNARVTVYGMLLTDQYPSTTDRQAVTAEADLSPALNRFLPLVKWLLALPHYIVLMLLGIAALVVTIVAWFAILITGRYPRGMFDFVVGVNRWGWRVAAYMYLLSTDKYPPFSLK